MFLSAAHVIIAHANSFFLQMMPGKNELSVETIEIWPVNSVKGSCFGIFAWETNHHHVVVLWQTCTTICGQLNQSPGLHSEGRGVCGITGQKVAGEPLNSLTATDEITQ